MCSASTTPVATPLPGFDTVKVSSVSSPTSTRLAPVVSTTSFGRVTIDRAVASAWKRTVATLPTSPSSVGMICISTDVPPPGLSVPNDQTSSPRGPCEAGGAVPSRRVPRGT